MKAMINKVYLEGILYDHNLEIKETGPNSKAPGTTYIRGTINIATDDAGINVVPVYYSYVTETTSTGKKSASFATLKSIVDGAVKTVIKDGKENAFKVRVDTAIAVNDFYDRNGALVTAKRNEGGFIHLEDTFQKKTEAERNLFEVDMIITNVRQLEANEEAKTPEKVIVKGCAFSYNKSLLPIELTATDPDAMNYFMDLGASEKEPVFTKVWGPQVSTTIEREIVEESAFGNNKVKTVTTNRKEFIIAGANREPYMWDDESTITAAELKDCIAKRETYLATIKQRDEEYKASASAPAAVSVPKNDGFAF